MICFLNLLDRKQHVESSEKNKRCHRQIQKEKKTIKVSQKFPAGWSNLEANSSTFQYQISTKLMFINSGESFFHPCIPLIITPLNLPKDKNQKLNALTYILFKLKYKFLH